MAKVVLKITKEGEVIVDSDYKGDKCMNSKIYKTIEKILEKQGEIDNIEYKFEKQKQNVAPHISIEDLI